MPMHLHVIRDCLVDQYASRMAVLWLLVLLLFPISILETGSLSLARSRSYPRAAVHTVFSPDL